MSPREARRAAQARADRTRQQVWIILESGEWETASEYDLDTYFAGNTNTEGPFHPQLAGRGQPAGRYSSLANDRGSWGFAQEGPLLTDNLGNCQICPESPIPIQGALWRCPKGHVYRAELAFSASTTVDGRTADSGPLCAVCYVEWLAANFPTERVFPDASDSSDPATPPRRVRTSGPRA